MQFSNPSTKNGLIQDITFLTGVDINAYPLPDRTRNINERYRQIWQVIFESYGGWLFMDSNISDVSTGVPYADQNLTSGTGLYALPSAALTVIKVDIVNSGGTREQLNPMTFAEFQQVGGDQTFSTNSHPLHYMLQGDVIRLLPTPNFTASSGLRVYFDQGISEFVAGDTTKTPGFDSIFHRALSVGASLDYLMAKGIQEKISIVRNMWEWYAGNPDEGRIGAIARFYSKRWKDRFPHKIGAGTDLVDEFH